MLNDIDGQGRDTNEIQLPHQFVPRDYQTPLWRAMVPEIFSPEPSEMDILMGTAPVVRAAKRAVLVWHRRAGKDKNMVNLMATRAAMDTPGNYIYLLPQQTQAKKIIWRGIGADGIRFIDHFPAALVKKKYDSELLVELINGATVQIGGADNYDAWMGTNPRGVIFSEYSLQDPSAWNYFRPILAENQGWAVFIYTARGHNHGYELRNVAKKKMEEGDPDWFFSELTVDDTKRPDGTPVISRKDIDAEIEAGMPEGMVEQEFYCSFDAGLLGAYYADIISGMKKREGATNPFGLFPHDPSYPVITAWDLGLNDANTVWFVQPFPHGPRVIYYMEEANVALSEWVRRVLEMPYNYAAHIAPHDIETREQSTGVTRKEFAMDLGLEFEVAPKLSRADGIEAVRALLPTCTFNLAEESVHDGLEAMMAYERVYDEKLKRFRDSPLHNWASHGADAFRTLAVAYDMFCDIHDDTDITVTRSLR